MMELHHHLGGEIRKSRERAGLSQAALARATRRSLQMIGMIERGGRVPSLETLIAISQVLHVPVRQFFPEEERAPEDLQDRIIRLVSSLSPRERLRVYRVLLAMLGD